MQSVQDTPPTPVASSELESLKTTISEIQSAYQNPIPEELFESIIRQIIPDAFSGLLAACQFRPLLQMNSIVDVATYILREKDSSAGQMDTDQEVHKVRGRLEASFVGKEALYRVAFSIYSIFLKQLQFFPQPLPSFDEIFCCSCLFAAQSLEAALTKAFAQALETMRIPEGATAPTVKNTPKIVQGSVSYSGKELRAIDTAVKLFSCIWKVSQQPQGACTLEDEHKLVSN